MIFFMQASDNKARMSSILSSLGCFRRRVAFIDPLNIPHPFKSQGERICFHFYIIVFSLHLIINFTFIVYLKLLYLQCLHLLITHFTKILFRKIQFVALIQEQKWRNHFNWSYFCTKGNSKVFSHFLKQSFYSQRSTREIPENIF